MSGYGYGPSGAPLRNGDPNSQQQSQMPPFPSPSHFDPRIQQINQQNIVPSFRNLNIGQNGHGGVVGKPLNVGTSHSSMPSFPTPFQQTTTLQRPTLPTFPRLLKPVEIPSTAQTFPQYSNGSSQQPAPRFIPPSFPRISAPPSAPSVDQHRLQTAQSFPQFPTADSRQNQFVNSSPHQSPQLPLFPTNAPIYSAPNIPASQAVHPVSLASFSRIPNYSPPNFPTNSFPTAPPTYSHPTPVSNPVYQPPMLPPAAPYGPNLLNANTNDSTYSGINQTTPPIPTMYANVAPIVHQQPHAAAPQIAPNAFASNFQNANANPLAGPSGGLDQAEGGRIVNLLHSRKILPGAGVETPKPVFRQDFRQINCSPDIFRCTVNAIPKTTALLQKSRLPLGILIHPYKDLSNLQVLACNTIVRCRACRSYINPFVTFIDQSRWRCNLCDRTNDLPQEFYHDPVTHTVGDPQRRPEVRTATIEYIAPQEYSLRPPQPAVYVFLLDMSFNAMETGYLETFCERLSSLLDHLPGDARTQIALIAFDRAIHFFQLDTDWRMLTVADLDEVFIPTTDGILVRLHENLAAIRDLLERLPAMFKSQRETHSCLGAAIQIAYKLITATGGRITVMQTCLPSIGPGALKSREDPNMRAAKEVRNLQPATDFYKTLALECSGSQVAVDLFLLAGQYADLASLSGIARYSGGSIYYYPGFNSTPSAAQIERFEAQLTRYLSRKIGFESVMRVRCTNGLSMHSFHGNFFVRSTDLLSLPNINPDAGYAVQVKMDENLSHTSAVSFQAALLYTSSKGERRIRVHTLHVPVTESLSEVFASADQEAIVTLVGKIAAERALSAPMGDVRDGIVYACEDALTAYMAIIRPQHSQLLSPFSLRLVPLFTQALLKNTAFRLGVSTTIDLRTSFILTLKCAPLFEAMLCIYPHLYAVHNIHQVTESLDEEGKIVKLERLHLSYENIERKGVYLLESAMHMIMYVTRSVEPAFCQEVLDAKGFEHVVDRSLHLPQLETEASARLRAFVGHRYMLRPMHPILEIIKEDSKDKLLFLQYLHDDRLESNISYMEFITQISQKIKAP